MSIAIRTFEVAMEMYGAERLPNYTIFDRNISVPCFNVAGTIFLHSGRATVTQIGNLVPKKIIERAMAELGEIYPFGGNHFYLGEIASVKGLLTVVSMLEGKYNKKLVNEFTDKTYKKLLYYLSIRNNVEIPLHPAHSPKMNTMCKLLAEYVNVVNPFDNNAHRLEKIIPYLDNLKFYLDTTMRQDEFRLALDSSSTISFLNNENGWSYHSHVVINSSCINTVYHYNNGNNGVDVDEIVCLDYRKNMDMLQKDIELRISLKTGLAWKNCKKEDIKSVTDEQIETMITYLRISIEELKKQIADTVSKTVIS